MSFNCFLFWKCPVRGPFLPKDIIANLGCAEFLRWMQYQRCFALVVGHEGLCLIVFPMGLLKLGIRRDLTHNGILRVSWRPFGSLSWFPEVEQHIRDNRFLLLTCKVVSACPGVLIGSEILLGVWGLSSCSCDAVSVLPQCKCRIEESSSRYA